MPGEPARILQWQCASCGVWRVVVRDKYGDLISGDEPGGHFDARGAPGWMTCCKTCTDALVSTGAFYAAAREVPAAMYRQKPGRQATL